MDYNAWSVDLERGKANHISGFQIQIVGNPDCPTSITPKSFPDGLTAVQQTRLLRSGFVAYREKYELIRSMSVKA